MECVAPLGHHRDADWVEEDLPQPDMATNHTATEPAVGFTSTRQRPGTNGTLRGGSFYRELCPFLKPQQEPQPGALEGTEWQHRDQEGAPSTTPTPTWQCPHTRDHHSHWLHVKVGTAAAHTLPQVSPAQTQWGACSFQSTAGHTRQVESTHLPGVSHTMETGQGRGSAM